MGDVVRFRPDGKSHMRLGLKAQDYRCSHNRVEVCEQLRRVTCQDCDEQLDPVEVIIYWARNWATYERAVDRYKCQIERLRTDLEELHRQERNVKARLKRAAAKLGDA